MSRVSGGGFNWWHRGVDGVWREITDCTPTDQSTPPNLDEIRTQIYDLEQAGRLKDAAELRAELKRMKGTVMG